MTRDETAQYVWMTGGAAGATKGLPAGLDTPAVTLAVAKKPGTNAVDLVTELDALMARLRGPVLPGNIEVTKTRDYGATADEKSSELMKHLGLATISVVLLMAVALGRREAVVVAVAVPVTLALTLASSYLFGYTLNRVTLFALIFAIGILVDDAIVVVENIERHMREFGKSAYQAAVDAMREVLSAVIVIGIVLVAVFVPVAFFPGTTGRLYQQFSLTIAFAVVLSVFNAITLTPALAALLLDKETHTHGRFFTMVNRVIDAGTSAYVATVRKALAWKWAMLVVFALGLWATWGITQVVPTAFVPEEDEGFFITVVQAPAGASLEYTDGVAKQVEKKRPQLEAYENLCRELAKPTAKWTAAHAAALTAMLDVDDGTSWFAPSEPAAAATPKRTRADDDALAQANEALRVHYRAMVAAKRITPREVWEALGDKSESRLRGWAKGDIKNVSAERLDAIKRVLNAKGVTA